MYTKGEWNISKIANDYEQYSIYADNKEKSSLICNSVEGKDNAQRIVQCVNSHDDLLEACKEAVQLFESIKDGEYKIDSFTTQPLRQAINKAEGGQE